MLNSPDATTNDPTNDVAIERREFLQFFAPIFLLMLPVVLAVPFLNNNDLDVRLASGFLHGHLYADNIKSTFADIIPYQGHYYLPFGPLPSLLEAPFVALIGMDFNTLALLFAFTMLNTWLLWRLLARLNVAGSAQLWLANLFFLGALYIAVATHAGSWELAKVIVVTLTLSALLCAESGRWVLAGVLVGGAVTARFSLLVTALYYVLIIVLSSEAVSAQKLRRLAQFALGLAGPLLLLFWYNYARFGNILETGYNLSIPAFAYQYAARAQGLLSFVHIPTNFYYMFLSGFDSYPGNQAPQLQFPWVQPSLRGMSIFVTTPALLYLFRIPLRDRKVWAALPTVLLGVLVTLMYYYTGEYQYGYSYLLDIMPFIFILLVAALRRVQNCNPVTPLTELPSLFKGLAFASIILGIWGMLWTSDVYQYWGNIIGQRLGGG